MLLFSTKLLTSYERFLAPLEMTIPKELSLCPDRTFLLHTRAMSAGAGERKPMCHRYVRALLIFTLLYAAANPAAQAATTVRVGYPQLNGGQTPLWNIPESKID